MSINLIPQQLKEDKDNRAIAGQVVFASSALLIMALILAGAFYAYNLYLTQYSEKLSEQLSSSNLNGQLYKDLEKKITGVNAKLSLIDNVLQTKFNWSEILTEIAASTPKNVQVRSLSLGQEEGKASITGTAAERRDIALLKEKLDSLPALQNVTFTTSSYNAAANNYNFSIKFEVIKKTNE